MSLPSDCNVDVCCISQDNVELVEDSSKVDQPIAFTCVKKNSCSWTIDSDCDDVVEAAEELLMPFSVSQFEGSLSLDVSVETGLSANENVVDSRVVFAGGEFPVHGFGLPPRWLKILFPTQGRKIPRPWS